MATFVLVPGAGGSAWYWHRVAAELADRGHETVALEFPAADPAAGLAAYAAIARAAAESRRDAGDLVVVGQSLGGFTAPLVASQVGADRLVLLNAMIPQPGETAGDWFDHTGAEGARRANDVAQGRDPDAEFEFQRRVARERLGLAAEMIPGGHLTALSHPSRVADGLERPLD